MSAVTNISQLLFVLIPIIRTNGEFSFGVIGFWVIMLPLPPSPHLVSSVHGQQSTSASHLETHIVVYTLHFRETRVGSHDYGWFLNVSSFFQLVNKLSFFPFRFHFEYMNIWYSPTFNIFIGYSICCFCSRCSKFVLHCVLCVCVCECVSVPAWGIRLPLLCIGIDGTAPLMTWLGQNKNK